MAVDSDEDVDGEGELGAREYVLPHPTRGAHLGVHAGAQYGGRLASRRWLGGTPSWVGVRSKAPMSWFWG